MPDAKHILVIDDDLDILLSMKAILDKSGFITDTASSSAEGLGKIENRRPDLILCDMMMEKVDSGARLAFEIKKKYHDIKVYLISSIGITTASNIDIEKMGFNGVLQKPVDPGTAVKTIKNAFGMK
jgi:DNA-binding NtrC family response regulator